MRFAALALVLLACGNDGMTGIGGIGGIGGVGGSGGSGGAPPDVIGTSYIDYWDDHGGEVGPGNDLVSAPPKAIIGTQTIVGFGDGSGNFIIPQVPDGALVQLGETYVLLGSERRLDFGYDQLGRSYAVHPTMSTPLELQISGMAPWAADDDIEILSSNSGTYGLLVAIAQNPPALGATSLDMTVDWMNLTGNNALIESSSGDTAIFAQLTHQSSSSGLSYLMASKSLMLITVAQMDGQLGHVVGSFSDAPPAGQLSLVWARSEFDALKLQVNPAAMTSFQGIYIDAQPDNFGLIFSASIHVLASEPPVGATDLDYGTVSYANPFATASVLFGRALHEFEVSYAMPGMTPTRISTFVSVKAEVPTFAAGPIRPPISPPVSVQIEGMDAFVPRSGVGTTPTLSWSPPAVGTASNYSVIVYELGESGTATTKRVLAHFYIAADSSSLHLPPGMLTMGKGYVFEVQAIAMPDVNLASSPFRVKLPAAQASALTAMVTP